MESLAYLHLALAYEEPKNIEPVPILKTLKLFEGLNWCELSSVAWMYWLSVAVLLTVLGMATQALATLEFGSNGSEVTDIQRQLQKLGYFNGSATGYFGSLTKDAVTKFQKDRGLTANGVVGTETEEALLPKSKPSPTPVSQTSEDMLAQGDRGQAVHSLQESLSGLGFYGGPLNGVFDDRTQASVMAFQKAKGLTADGVVGPQTKAKLSLAASGSKPKAVQSNRGATTLKQGDSSTQVANLQRRLRELGYFKGRMTGYFDQETQDAVIKFQKEQILPAYGTVEQKTLVVLDNMTSRASMQALQKRLKAKGFYKGPIDGTLNSQTKAAIAEAQKAYGIIGNDDMSKRF